MPRPLLAFVVVLVAACAPRESAVVLLPPAPEVHAPPPSAASPPVRLLPITVVGDRLDLGRSFSFVTNSADLTNARDNESLLHTILDYLARRPEVTKLRIEVHSDSTGMSEYNLRLSQARADRILGTLLDRGVAPTRLSAVGWGSSHPIAPNRSAEGRAQNRRTELHVEELDGTPIAGRAPPS